MSETTNKSVEKFSIQASKKSPQDEVESARILLREGLIEEAKKTLFRVLVQRPEFPPALVLLQEIETLELREIYRDSKKPSRIEVREDAEEVIEALERDLSLRIDDEGLCNEFWIASVAEEPPGPDAGLDARGRFDLGIAFFEMGCFSDALRELTRAEKKIRIEQTFLGDMGVAIAALRAQCLIELDRAFEAKAYLEPILLEPDLGHENKMSLYYAMGLSEQTLGHDSVAAGWFQKIAETDLEFRDVATRLGNLLRQKQSR